MEDNESPGNAKKQASKQTNRTKRLKHLVWATLGGVGAGAGESIKEELRHWAIPSDQVLSLTLTFVFQIPPSGLERAPTVGLAVTEVNRTGASLPCGAYLQCGIQTVNKQCMRQSSGSQTE